MTTASSAPTQDNRKPALVEEDFVGWILFAVLILLVGLAAAVVVGSLAAGLSLAGVLGSIAAVLVVAL
ncbi:hypothetical protein [Rhodococcus chondri]|uniref:Uncharacterized protein n=1 Tax=Rhodococcus chondri TaxID=3065941 RepID=A0ABU7JV71_9NOCA|nr:hypothetical protein [Rhodococcus sp. CC-R104]MEE2033419.1 hypothetical protein [Rhodococcus sp. CC-R104]